METKIDALLRKYAERFHKCFPVMLCMGMGDEAICAAIQACLDENKPYAPVLDPDTVY